MSIPRPGLLLVPGPVYAMLRGHLENERYWISGDDVANAWTFSTGAALAAGVRVSDRLTLVTKLRGPLPYAPAEVSGYLVASVGTSLQW